ncbi:MAG TPA: HAD-IIIA family hydrolase [Chitinophagaceae bacterium]|nr:HAD-IIIA family hydrolase [Chitinophagaceae bacterium]
MLDLKTINTNWTLFLDRDGVINLEKHQDYVYHYEEFMFYEGVKEALRYLSTRFKRIIIITNQRGVGRELMTEQALIDIHSQMVADIEAVGGRIHKIYYCTSTDDAHPNRKPNPGLFREAQNDFPDISPVTSIMVGNNLSDMQFGRNAGMHTVFVRTTNPGQSFPHPLIDLAFNDLPSFAKALQEA